jgi:hypothetical protein
MQGYLTHSLIFRCCGAADFQRITVGGARERPGFLIGARTLPDWLTQVYRKDCHRCPGQEQADRNCCRQRRQADGRRRTLQEGLGTAGGAVLEELKHLMGDQQFSFAPQIELNDHRPVGVSFKVGDGAPTTITTAFGNIVVTRIGDSGTSKGVAFVYAPDV